VEVDYFTVNEQTSMLTRANITILLGILVVTVTFGVLALNLIPDHSTGVVPENQYTSTVISMRHDSPTTIAYGLANTFDFSRIEFSARCSLQIGQTVTFSWTSQSSIVLDSPQDCPVSATMLYSK
jgi:hypothetical protein